MTDYTGEFFLDPDIIIKQEPDIGDNVIISTSASVPIPSRRVDSFGLRDFNADLESTSPFQDINNSNQTTNNLTMSSMWATRIIDLDNDYDKKSDALIHMDEDYDIFQVDKADLIQGPTLAELNANDENLLEDLNFDDLVLPGEGVYSYFNEKLLFHSQTNNHLNNLITSSAPQTGSGFYNRDSLEISTSVSSSPFNTFSPKTTLSTFSPTSQTSSTSSLLQSASSPSLPPTGLSMPQKHSALHELLLKRENYSASPDRNILGQSVPSHSTSPVSGTSTIRSLRTQASILSSSAPAHTGMDSIWQRREPRKHLLSTGSLIEAGSASSLSGGLLSPDTLDFSNEDDGDSEEEDSEHYEDFSSDDDSDNENIRNYKLSRKHERYFWQYNVQSKGPKGQRLIMKTRMEDPHVLNEVTDPVFSPSCSVRGIKHSGKARKGDGNDLTPNPRKLFNIGKELDKLGRIINNMTPVSELPFNIRPKSRKEKNKLASRACRLKKKAQHEANKIKLDGLENEHKRIIDAITQCKQVMNVKMQSQPNEIQENLTNRLENMIKTATKTKIAGNTTEYVNKVIDKVKGNSSAVRFEQL